MGKLEYKHYMLILLTVVGTFNYVDRFVLSLVLEPIKQEFQLSDSQLGFLTGFAFASFYAIAGIPIARWADRGNRNTIITLTTALWSSMVALSALAGNFTQLLLLRVGVGVGEAGCLPPANSLIADYFDRAERPKAMAIYWLCGSLSVVIGFIAGGWLVEYFGWRLTFAIIGVPGIFLALLVKFTLREPRAIQGALIVETQPPFKQVLTTVWQQSTTRHIVMAFVVSYFFSQGIAQWLPTFFIRSYGITAAEAGTWLAFSWGAMGLIGIYLGGHLAEKYAGAKEGLQLRCCAVGNVVMGLCYIAIFLSTNQYQTIVFLSIAAMAGGAISGPIFSAIQSLVNPQIRSVTLALIFLMGNFIGLGLGPVAAGAVSDLLLPIYGDESLRYALLMFAPGLSWVAYYNWKAGKTVEADIKAIELAVASGQSDGISDPQTLDQANLGLDKS